MPEYLAPGVYVEEVDSGAKPIEGVSTSTSGMVGVTERGPVDVPVLVTSVGEYARVFGGRLRGGDDFYGSHCHLPLAIEGFFTNGGKRVYVVRALDAAATRASSALFDRGADPALETRLVRAAGEGTGSAAGPPSLVVLPGSALAAGDWVRVGDGSTAEYRQVAVAPAATDVVVPVDVPLFRSHLAGEPVEEWAVAVDLAFTLEAAAGAGATTVVLRGATADVDVLAPDTVLELGSGDTAEYRLVRSLSSATVVATGVSTVRVRLDAELRYPYAAGDAASRFDFSAGAADTATVQSAPSGSVLVYLDVNPGGAFVTRSNVVVVGTGATREVRRIGELDALSIDPGALDAYAVGSLVDAVEFPAARTASAAAAAGDTELVLQPGESAGLVAGQQVVVDPTGTPQTATVQLVAGDGATLSVTALSAAVTAGDEVVPAPKTLTAAAAAGARVVAVHDRMGLTEGGLVRVGSGAGEQVVTVVSLPGQSGVRPDAGNIAFEPPLADPAPIGTPVSIPGAAAPVAGRQLTALVLQAEAGAEELVVGDGAGFAAAETVRVTSPGGDVTFHRLTGAATPVALEEVELDNALARSHPAGSGVVGRAPLIDVEALDAGAWGNRIRVSVTDSQPGLVARTTLATIVNPTTVRLGSRAGVQAGTVLEVVDPATGAVLDGPLKVRAVDRTTGNILLAGGLSALQAVAGNVVRSREYTLDVLVLRQPDPATPSRNEQVIDRESFRHLSLDPRHSNYVGKVVGSIDGPLRLWDHRPEGASLYVRVRDLAPDAAAAEATRLGPETLTDRLPDGREVPARMRLERVVGDDAIGTLTDAHYLGADHVDPDRRTGLQSLRNVEEVSIVAVPGQVGAALQQGVIDHCELMRYRFAVLDTPRAPRDTLADAQEQRQQFDTKYAALYYPWLSIPDPFPENLADVRAYAVPPSGHMVGVYARTDIDRGVHKAPANEVVRGITGLQRKVNKEQQDILNPYPVNLNVIRDFRDNNRGIRVYGGRVITSDPDWKYVNVRRLMIFIEASIDRGLQWVVFEPNSEPLWARVQRTITNFLTVVWRNGALEGTSPEEAFFVRCDRTTMTQADLDNGRLIVQVGVAPVKPAEFVIVRIGLWTARSDS